MFYRESIPRYILDIKYKLRETSFAKYTEIHILKYILREICFIEKVYRGTWKAYKYIKTDIVNILKKDIKTGHIKNILKRCNG